MRRCCWRERGGFGEKKFAREQFDKGQLTDDAGAHARRQCERGDEGRPAARGDHARKERAQSLPEGRGGGRGRSGLHVCGEYARGIGAVGLILV